MKITIDWLKGKSACSEGLTWFEKKFPKGAERLEIVNALVKADHFQKKKMQLKIINYGIKLIKREFQGGKAG